MVTFPAGSGDDEARFRYVAGFALDDTGRVALVRKARPEWQVGKLNGVGGKIEPGEAADVAVRREFLEEAGVDLDGWELLCTLRFPDGYVKFYRCFLDAATLESVRSVTDEPIELWYVSDLALPSVPLIPNLRWLVPLAAYRHDRYVPFDVCEDVPFR